MNVLFEDDGQLKAGTVLADHDASLQIEAASGKRLKVKAANVLLRFDAPSPSETLHHGQKLAGELDATFLWEVSSDSEFGFDELAREYYGANATPPEKAAVAMLLHGAPMHFYKRGKGRYRRAPVDALKAALASVERKKREADQMATWIDELARGELPLAFAPKLAMLLYKPDRNALEWKALAAACEAGKTNPVALLARCGAIDDTHEFHFNRFITEAFPRGLAFAEGEALPPLPELPLPLSQAFSIDDHTTTEIDDAFSVREVDDGFLIGIHIALPALAIARGAPHDRIARERLSTVYMPGRKLTMLPDAVVDVLTLRAGGTPPVLSLYVRTTADGNPLSHETRLERIRIAANLRLAEVSDAFTQDLPDDSDPRWTSELRALRRLAENLAAQRGKPEIQRIDYSFYVDWDADSGFGERGRVSIVPRPRGSPLDKLIAELMIHVNNTWGRLLAEHGAAGLYRTQSMGKVKMSTRPGEHQGLALSHYLWASSPLRRYSDLVNQRQLVAVLQGDKPPYGENDAELFAVLADFEATYGQYAEFQNRMEHYWCLRWLKQEAVSQASGTVLRENTVRFDNLPLVVRLPDMPPLRPDTPVRIAIVSVDLLTATLESRYAGVAESAIEVSADRPGTL
ncbi:MAG TPA: RNB domain-containing ribonuclease [Casimicrobiaceae bacterium]|nr:RNB domain-containing ribonuclease [Casimicrobiaceae bacterium]